MQSDLTGESKNQVWNDLVEYETSKEGSHLRKLEENEFIINELKKNLCELTEKRFRASVQQHNNDSQVEVPKSNIEFMLNEKDSQLREVLKDLDEKSNEILKLKQTIKDQDLIILSHNSNIYV